MPTSDPRSSFNATASVRSRSDQRALGNTSWSALFALLAMPVVSALCVTAVQLYLAQGLRPLTTSMVAALTLFIYALNGFSDHTEDAINDPGRAFMLRRSAAWTLGASGAVLLIVSVLLAARSRLHFSYAAIAFVGMAYSFRVIPVLRHGAVRWLRLKDVALIKNLTIAMTWAAAVFMIPILDVGTRGRTPGALACVAGTYLVLVIENSVFCDLRDELGDRQAGVRTLPVIFGSERCFAAAFALALAWGAILLGGYALGLTDGPTTVFLLLADLAYPTVVWWAKKRRAVQQHLEKVLIESSDVFFALGLILVSSLTPRS